MAGSEDRRLWQVPTPPLTGICLLWVTGQDTGNTSTARTAPQATSKLVTGTQVAGGKELQISCAATKVFKLHQLLQSAGASLRGRSPSGLIAFCIETNLG